MSEKLETSREELTALRVKEMKDKNSLEFNRYKQDCRKKALDMAHQELLNLTAASQATKGAELNVSELADKYYNWLMSIPNE